MGIEIERKFLVNDNFDDDDFLFIPIRQGYISVKRNVRVRIIGNEGYLTIKGKKTGLTCLEYEFKIPIDDACEMFDTVCKHTIIKERATFEHDGSTWEVDRFLGNNEGLMVAEIELKTEDQSFNRPIWLGKEVTEYNKYANKNLAKHPFSDWTFAEQLHQPDCFYIEDI